MISIGNMYKAVKENKALHTDLIMINAIGFYNLVLITILISNLSQFLAVSCLRCSIIVYTIPERQLRIILESKRTFGAFAPKFKYVSQSSCLNLGGK